MTLTAHANKLRAEVAARVALRESLEGQLEESRQNVRELTDFLSEAHASPTANHAAAAEIAALLKRKRQLEAERNGYMLQCNATIREIKSLQRRFSRR